MVFSNNTYDKLTWVAQYLLPALGTLYFALSSIWGLPYGEQVVGTITAVDAFLGVLLGISDKNYNGDGQLVINADDPEKDTYSLELNGPIDGLSDKKQVTFIVKNSK